MTDYEDSDAFVTDRDMFWVIPHGSSLDYCHVHVEAELPNGRCRVSGRRNHGWTPDRALIRCRVAADKLTTVPSWHTDFLKLYDDPHDPRLKGR